MIEKTKKIIEETINLTDDENTSTSKLIIMSDENISSTI